METISSEITRLIGKQTLSKNGLEKVNKKVLALKVVLQFFVAQMHKNLMMVKEQRNRRKEETNFDSTRGKARDLQCIKLIDR